MGSGEYQNSKSERNDAYDDPHPRTNLLFRGDSASTFWACYGLNFLRRRDVLAPYDAIGFI
jgi:hypothetical protein